MLGAPPAQEILVIHFKLISVSRQPYQGGKILSRAPGVREVTYRRPHVFKSQSQDLNTVPMAELEISDL